MQAILIDYTPEPEKTVAMAARLCYSPVGAVELAQDLGQKQIESLLEKIIAAGHTSTLEHASFTFAIEGVSRVLTHQLVRHRIASYSQQSQRYVAAHNFAYIIPPQVAKNTVAREKFTALMETARHCYDELIELGVPKEDARYVLTNATETKIVVTMNARELHNFFRLRCCERAQWEIRALANHMLAEVRKVAPILFRHAGPPCVTEQRCPEGKLSCGRLAVLQAKAPQG